MCKFIVYWEEGLYFNTFCLVKAGIVSKEHGKLYHDLFAMRLTGDYDDTYGLTEDDVLPYMEPAKQLIQEATELALKRIKENA